jgi:octaprenyl-diphosphate synthase
LALGTAYQVYDDCLDLFGSEVNVGKSLGTDLANGKLTLPVLIVLEKGVATDQSDLRRYIEQWNPRHFPRVLELIEKYGGQEISRGMIHEHLEQARQSLNPVPDSPSRGALLALTDFLAQQTDILGIPS